MPKSVVLKLAGDQERYYAAEISSLFHGALMELVDSEYVTFLHVNQLHPYSQSIVSYPDGIRWTVNALNEDAEREILMPLMADSLTEVTLKHKERVFTVIDKTEHSITYQDLVREYYFGKKTRYLRIRFLTPTSFKQNGKYCLFPDVRLIFQSLMNKYDQASPDHTVFSEELLDHYTEYASIVRYRLQSAVFYLEGTKVPGFQGEITIRITGPQQMVNMAWMLAKFGEYAGVGIKTGIGMGAIKIIEQDQSRKEAD